jgi:hypothetical protein
MTPDIDVIPKVRTLLNDETTPYRWKDSELLGWVNECLDVLVDIRPDLFNSLGTHTCTTGSEQLLTFDRVRLFQEVARVVGGNAVLPTDRTILDKFRPSWYMDTPAAAQNWMLHPESFKKFYLYPPAPYGQEVEVRFVQAPTTLSSISDQIPLPENYAGAVTAYVVARAEAKDDEQINANRMQQFLSDFAGMVKGGGQ